MEVTDDDIHEIQKKGPITFHAILKYYADKLLPILQDTEEQMKYKLSKDKKQYSELVKEKSLGQIWKGSINYILLSILTLGQQLL